LLSISPAVVPSPRGTTLGHPPHKKLSTLKALNRATILCIIAEMAQSLAKILTHTVFSTKDRRPYLQNKPLRDELHHYLGGILENHNCQSIIIGGVQDHVHILSTFSRTWEVAEMVKELKRSSSLWLKGKYPDLHDFAWQNGYGIFSIGFSQIETVKKYIAGQEQHHLHVSFQDEFREFLKRYEIEFDERYVWE
jgi:REP element-mobilizing transposase RayT